MNKNLYKIINNKDKWMLGEDIPNIDFQFSEIWLSSFVNDLKCTVGMNYKSILAIYNGFDLKFYYGEKDSDLFAEHVLSLIVKKPTFGEKINDEIRKHSDILKEFCRNIDEKYLSGLSDQQLALFYKQLDEIHTELYAWGWLPNAVDMFHNNFSNYLKSVLSNKLPKDQVNQALVILSAFPEKSIFQKEHESFLKLVILRQSGESKEKLEKEINKHLKKYFYLKHLWLGEHGVFDFKYYENEINKQAKQENANNILKREVKEFKKIMKERKDCINKLKFNKREINIFNTYAEFAVTKAYRRDAQIFWAYKMDFVFAELAKRFAVPVKSIRFMRPTEVIKCLSVSKIDLDFKNELKKRSQKMVYYAEYSNDVIITGDEVDEIERSLEKLVNLNITEIKGQIACLGVAKGKVRIVNSPNDIKKMKKGDVLVSIATNPDIVTAMKLAAAIVTEQGGITSHAAIVSRELNIPCVIGTKIATKVLRDGDLVEVDANKGVVKILK